MQETKELWVQSLGGEDPLEEEMATCSSILAWRVPWTEEPGRLQAMRSRGVRHDGAHRQLHMSPPPEPPSQPPLHSIPLGCHRALDLSALCLIVITQDVSVLFFHSLCLLGDA